MTRFPNFEIETPGGKWFPVNCVEPEFTVRIESESGNSKEIVVPLVDSSGVNFGTEIVKERIAKKRDCPILLTGDPGIGKSTLALWFALLINNMFSLDDVTFWLEDFAQRFNANLMGDAKQNRFPQNLLDESGHALFGQRWFDQAQIELAKTMIVTRILKQITYFPVPRRKQLNSQVRERPFMWIHVYEPHEYEQGSAKLYLAPPEKQSEFYETKYWEPKLVFTFKELKGQFWDAYEEKKIQFVNEATEQLAKGKGNRFREVLLMKEFVRIGYTQEKIAEIMGYRNSSKVSKLLSES